MSQSIAESKRTPVEDLDPEVTAFREQFEDRSTLDQIIRQGAQQMLQRAIDAEVESFIDRHDDRRDEQGRRLVVRNGSLPSRKIPCRQDVNYTLSSCPAIGVHITS